MIYYFKRLQQAITTEICLNNPGEEIRTPEYECFRTGESQMYNMQGGKSRVRKA